MIHVCSLSRLHDTVRQTGARHVVSLLGSDDLVRCPDDIAPSNHLWLKVHDITAEIEGQVAPAQTHVEGLLTFVRRWDRSNPLVVHCYAGISRSTASAYVTICALNPHRSEMAIAQALRAASPTASPNQRIISVADLLLGRDGRMVAAIDAIGRGVFAEEAEPFRLDLE